MLYFADTNILLRFLNRTDPDYTVTRAAVRIIKTRGDDVTTAAQNIAEFWMEVAVATGYDPLLDNEPELARTMAASVKQRIAFGERAGEKVRRIGSGFGYEGERP